MHPLIEKHLPEIQTLCKKHAVERLYLFGSYATGQAKADSDVDFLVSFREMSGKNVVDQFFDFKFSLEKGIGKEIDLLTELQLKNPFLIESVKKNRILIFESSKRDHALMEVNSPL